MNDPGRGFKIVVECDEAIRISEFSRSSEVAGRTDHMLVATENVRSNDTFTRYVFFSSLEIIYNASDGVVVQIYYNEQVEISIANIKTHVSGCFDDFPKALLPI